MCSNIRHLLDLDDLSNDEIDWIIAGPYSDGKTAAGALIGLVFLQGSLRTHLGFAAAATRLGASPLSVHELRHDAGWPHSETLADTLRVVAGMTDLVVVRPNEPLDREMIRSNIPVPVINAGEPIGGHPTQALIELIALQKFVGPIQEINVGICGDLTMRTSRSLLRLLNRRPPRLLKLIAPRSRSDHGVVFDEELRDRVICTETPDFSDLDALIITGIAPLPDGDRSDYTLTTKSAQSLRSDAVVVAPMPLIDDISTEMLGDPRVKIYEQSDLGVPVRMSILQFLLRNTGPA